MKAAQILSVILGPQLWLPIILIIFMYKTNLSPNQVLILLPSLLILHIIIPVIFILYALRKKRISAWDLPIRNERYVFLLITLITYSASILLVYKYGNSLLLNLVLIETVQIIIFLIITLFWKISLHASLNTTGSIMINLLLGGKVPFLYLTIPTVIWARYKLKRHTLGQLTLGFLLSTVITLGFIKFFPLN